MVRSEAPRIPSSIRLLRRYPIAVGVIWATPNTPSNRQAYGSTANQYRTAPWPQVRATCLMDTHTHLIRAASLSGMALGELTSARELIAHVPSRSQATNQVLSNKKMPVSLTDWHYAKAIRSRLCLLQRRADF